MKQKHSQLRRANALILVVGVLVLLVLVTTAYLTRTQGTRVTAKAQRVATARTNSARFIAQAIADDVALALFVKPELPTGGAPQGSANNRRRLADIGEARWTHDPNNPYNFASYAVVPWTNPPDDFNRVDDNGSGFLDDNIGPNNPLGGPSFGDARWLRDTEPQRADLRIDVATGDLPDEWTDVDGTPDTFTHWRHLTNLSQSTNAWRPVRNIANIGGDGVMTDLDVPVEQWPNWRPTINNLVTTGLGFDLPLPANENVLDNNGNFWSDWAAWYSLDGWVNAQTNSDLLPLNFLNLSDLDDDGVQHESGERPMDAFEVGTPRWMVERTLADTDGDGFTDAFWHLSPYEAGADTRQVVAVSITDNSGKVNFNVGSRFHRVTNDDSSQPALMGERTRGHTPSDIALVAQNDAFSQHGPTEETNSNWKVGFLDTPANSPNWIVYGEVDDPLDPRVTVAWDTDRWQDQEYASILDEVGVQVTGSTPNDIFYDIDANPYASRNDPWDDVTSQFGRLWYWQLFGRNPFNAKRGFRPYNLSDELELRMNEGNNYQFIGSRFENSLNRVNANGDVGQQFIRSDFNNSHEASELRDQLTNSQLVFDNRRKITLFSGSRNDLLPPWLRWEDRFANRYDPDQTEGDIPSGDDSDPLAVESYFSYNSPTNVWGQMFPIKIVYEALQAASNSPGQAQQAFINITDTWRAQAASKVDLREYYGTFAFGEPWWESNSDGKLTFSERTPLALLLAMTDAQESGTSSMFDGSETGNWTGVGRSVAGEMTSASVGLQGDMTDPYQQTRVMAAGLASNMAAYKDDDDQWRDHSLLPFNPLGTLAKGSIALSAAVSPPLLGRQRDHDQNALPLVYPNFPNAAGGSVQMLGLEAQPFIMETFIAHVHEAKAPEPSGACCLAGCGTEPICEEVSEETCLSLLGGLEFYPDALCVDVTCPILLSCWSCCLPAGNCIEISGDHCITLGGTYRDGELCCEIQCGGACCFDADADDLVGCELLSEDSCTDMGGEYLGIDTDCVSTPCAPEGACCLPSGSCVDIREAGETTCNNLGGVFQLGRLCIDDVCGGACCLDSGQCTNVTISTCFELNGSYQLGVICSDDPCGSGGGNFGACCLDSVTIGADGTSLNSGSCVYVSEETCENFDGTYFSGSDCSDIVCFGACCLPKGGCEDVSVRTCEDQLFGSFQGAGTTCDTITCTPRGGCCVDVDGDGVQDECVDITNEVCAALNGVYSGNDIDCNTDPCDGATTPVLGGCCIANNAPSGAQIAGICEDLSAAQCATIGGTFSGNTILCSTDPCGEGACCITHTPQVPSGSGPLDLPIGFCLEVNAMVCYDMGGSYKGDGTFCDLAPCDTGACCIDDFRCTVVTEGLCEILAGNAASYAGDGTTCDDCLGAPALVGACCLLNTGECIDVSIVHCEQLAGVFAGNGILCSSDPCDDPDSGACCLPASTCETLLESTCDLYGGVYRGDSIVCAETLCASTGGCCLGSGSCINVVLAAECTTLGGDFLGTANDCAGSTCTTGSCCLANGSCMEVLSLDYCEVALEGSFTADTSCSTDPCGETGGCCLGSGSCLDVFTTVDSSNNEIQSASSECHELGGSFFIGQFCATLECGGACCFESGDDAALFCEEITRDLCEVVLSGSFQGYGSECSGEPCCDIFEGACCVDNACYELTEDICKGLGGEFNGISSSCEDGSCTTQGCCLPNGFCENVLPTTCLGLGGVVVGSICVDGSCGGIPDTSAIGACCISEFQLCETVRNTTCVRLGGAYIGDDTTCFDATCPAVFEGACCLGIDGCITLPETVCVLISGSFKGVATSCCEGICDIGACCLPTGECEEISVNFCDVLAGNYQGDGQVCIDDPCVNLLEGACCYVDTFCVTITEEACIALRLAFNPDDEFPENSWNGAADCSTSTCDPAALGACCLVDGTCAQQTLADCQAVGGTFVTEGISCDFISCAAPLVQGACCLPDLPCANILEGACFNLGGVYQGDGVECNTNPCAKGACCIITFECTEVTEYTCSQIGGDYQDDGSLCADGACCCLGGSSIPGRPDGACCLGIGQCVEVTENSCLLLAGVYQGDDSLCTATVCIVGACCLESSSCMEVSSAFCIAHGGEYSSDGTLCSDCDLDCSTDIGACCLPTGQCKEVTQFVCNDLTGLYWGDGSSCSPSPCGLGACCVSSGSCLMVVDGDACDLISGTYQGDGTACASSTCEPHYLVTPDTDECPQETVAVVQFANPFDRVIDLTTYTVEFFGQRVDLSFLEATNQQYLYPSTPENPATLILYAMTDEASLSIPKDDFAPAANPQFRVDWLDFLDLDPTDHPVETIIAEVPEGDWSTKRDVYDTLTDEGQHAVALYKTDADQLVLIDRLDRPNEFNSFSKRIVDDMENEWDKVDKEDDADDGFIDTEIIVDDPANPHDVLFVQWDRATRAWGVDVPDLYGWQNDLYDSWERNPRFVFSARDNIRSLDQLNVINATETDPLIDHISVFNWKWELASPEDPDDMDGDGNPDSADDDIVADDPDPWFTVETWSPRGDNEITTDGLIAGGLRKRKPTYFDMNYQENAFFPDKGWYGQSRKEAIHDPANGAWVPHEYAADGTFAANPAFLDFEFDPFDATAADGIGVNEARNQDLDLDDQGFQVGDGTDGEAERDMAFPFAMQMLQKDGDFEQVGEILNCWLFGHMIESDIQFDPVANPDDSIRLNRGPLLGGDIHSSGTLTTYSEFMLPKLIDKDGDGVGDDEDTDGNIDWDWWAPLTGVARFTSVDDDASAGIDETLTEFHVDARVNRLRYGQGVEDFENPDPSDLNDTQQVALPMLVGGSQSGWNDGQGSYVVEQYPWPRLSVAGRILDSFVCDGPGRLGGDLQPSDTQWFSFYNANGFTGKSTPGMININTATVEAMRALPHMNKIVHATHQADSGSDVVGDVNPRSLIPESIVQWRENGNGFADQVTGTGIVGGPDYSNRTWRLGLGNDSILEETRGFSSPSQIGLLSASPYDTMETELKPEFVVEPWSSSNHQAIRGPDAWRIDYAGLEPFSEFGSGNTNWIRDGVGAHISTDVNSRNVFDQFGNQVDVYREDSLIGDRVSGDSEELNLLQAGISNLITTTSDVFTVHMRIRTFRRNPITDVWDATDLDFIIDDSRYVMLVDRSEVNSPQDKPKILYFEKLPN